MLKAKFHPCWFHPCSIEKRLSMDGMDEISMSTPALCSHAGDSQHESAWMSMDEKSKPDAEVNHA
jgi:hypothetical protein